MLDILITGAKVYDGAGNPWYRADVGLKAGRIAAIGRVKGKAKRKINAAGPAHQQSGGLALCPGFIDVHTHADGILQRPSADNVLRQGVTTVVSGNCGDCILPVGRMLDGVEAARPAINYATLVGHGTIRRRVMGMANRKPTRRELADMRRIVDRSMRQGAVGLSTGLIYVPGAYAKVDEIVALAEVAAAYGGVYASHKRNDGTKIFQAIREAATIGKRARIPVEISHLKVRHGSGAYRKGRADDVLAAIARHREEGIEVTFDNYPYTASCTSLAAAVIPPRLSVGGKLEQRLRDRATRRRIRNEVSDRIAVMGGAGKITIASFPPDSSAEGKSLAEVARARKRDVVTTAMDMVVEGSPSCLFHIMRREDVARFICSPECMIGSDGGVVRARRGVVHPRNYGTFPRILREYVRERKLLRAEEAIRKMTSLPARKFGIPERGMIAVGMVADIVIFDLEKISDRATFDDPHAFPVGLKCVLVNGRVAWNGRSIARRRAGVVIRRR